MDIASIALTRSIGKRFRAGDLRRWSGPHGNLGFRIRIFGEASGNREQPVEFAGTRRSGLRVGRSRIAAGPGGSVALRPQSRAAAVASPAVAAAVDSQAVALAVVVATQVGPAVVAATRAAAADADNLPVEFDYAARGKSRLIHSLDYCAVLAWHPKQSPYAGSICCDRE